MSNKQCNVTSWGDRFALIDQFSPTDDAIRTVFGLTQDELDTARTLRNAGTFAASKNLNTKQYAHVFSSTQPKGTLTMDTPKIPTATTHAKPETASKPVKAPKKRGRKGDKIFKALAAVSTTPSSVDTFIAQHDVSLAVLRQAKRFVASLDAAQAQTIGKINVRQDKTTKKLMIWREDI
jgi:hypothetical protein